MRRWPLRIVGLSYLLVILAAPVLVRERLAAALLLAVPAPPAEIDKLTLARAFADAHDVRLDQAVGYANAREDRFLLAEVGEAVAVRPDLRLRGLARRAGWEILEAPT